MSSGYKTLEDLKLKPLVALPEGFPSQLLKEKNIFLKNKSQLLPRLKQKGLLSGSQLWLIYRNYSKM